MHDSVGMRLRQSVGDLNADGKRLRKVERLAFHSRIQRFTFDVLHGDEASTIFFADFINGTDVWVIQLGCCLRFSDKPPSCLLI